jgi:protein transport protein SEC31
VLIYDLARPDAPTSSSPGAKTNQAGVTCIAWNKKVPHILASCTAAGETNIWDLRQKRTVLSFRDSSHQNSRATGLAWNPLVSTQIVVTYANPNPEIWDLRKSMAPKLKLEGGHHTGVLSVSWCPHDSQLLLTAGEDGRAVCWSPEGQVLHNVRLKFDVFSRVLK